MELNKHLIFALLLAIIFLSIGTIYYNKVESWSHIDSFYFSTMTLTTIGYGDLAPTLDESKIFTSVYALLGIGVIFYLIGSVIAKFFFQKEVYFDKFIDKFQKK
jgi:voltage-gated potassium channel Kch